MDRHLALLPEAQPRRVGGPERQERADSALEPGGLVLVERRGRLGAERLEQILGAFDRLAGQVLARVARR